MITRKMYLHAIQEFIFVVLFSMAISFFSVNANAVDRETNGIIIGRYVPQHSAIRTSIVPGRPVIVDTSPDDIVINSLGAEKSNNKTASLNELNEKEFAAISADTPLRNINSEINLNSSIPTPTPGSGIGSNVMQSTSGISAIIAGNSGAINNTVNRATTSIGQAISGATGFLK